MKKFNLNGVNVELSKEKLQEKLQEMLKEYDKPKGEIKKDIIGHAICLYKNGSLVENGLVKCYYEEEYYDLSSISSKMAGGLEDAILPKEYAEIKESWSIYYNHPKKYGYVVEKHTSYGDFKTGTVAYKAAELLNKSKDMKEGLRRVCN